MRFAITGLILFLFLTIGCAQAPSLELTKDEALHLMDLKFRVDAAQADLQQFVAGLAVKYKVSLNDFNLDVRAGKFVAKDKKNEKTGN